MSSTVQIDQDTFQDLVKFYGETFNLPPLAAKIYAYLIFDFDKNGICFEEFVEILAASKSSVSANLNLLLNANLITDFNKIDERKRYFLINENYIVLRFEEIIEKMKREIQILDKLNSFRKTKSAETNPRFEIYKSLLNKNIVNIQDTLLKL
ncbi:MAG: transcriptional regulator [Kaistella sp.]|nr:transcriptional regulator [Kaistella sp.]